MSIRTRSRTAGAIVSSTLVAALALVGGVALAPAAGAAAPTTAKIDYFADSFAGLRDDSVFTPVTFERLERLLDSAGTYAVLIGGPADPTTTATVIDIDAVAQQYGIDTIYTFDPRLDGATLDIRTTDNAELAALYPRLVERLNKDTTPQFGDPTSDPYLFVYDRDHTQGGSEDRILTALTGAQDPASFNSAEYRTQLDAVFAPVALNGVSVQSQFEFFRDATNQRHKATYADATRYGGDIFTAGDGEDFVLQSVTYPELVNILESDGEHVILFGGTWCHNTRAVIKDVNRAAAASGVDTVYVFDLRLDGWSGGQAHIRDSGSAFAHLYGDLVEKYLPNLQTQYVTSVSASQRVEYRPDGDAAAPLAIAQKLQVPYLIRYDKAAGSGPIVENWLRENADGSVTEYMSEWWWVSHLPGNNSRNLAPETWAAQQEQNWAFAAEAIAKINQFFDLAAAPASPATPTASASGSQVTVNWVAPADGGSALTGFEVALDGGTPVAVAPGVTSHVFSAVPAGSHTVTVTAINHLGASVSPTATVVVTAPAATPTLTVTGDLRPGGSITIHGSGFTTGTVSVEIHSTPQTLGATVAASDGVFTLRTTVPSDIGAGAHSIVAFIGGVEVARSAVTVSPRATVEPTETLTGNRQGPGLAVTGGDGFPYLFAGVALLLLIAGAAVLAVRRQRA